MESATTATCLLEVRGMRCQNCVRKVEGSVGAKGGVISVKVNLELKECDVQYDSSLVNPSQLVCFITELGFDSNIKSDSLPGINLYLYICFAVSPL